MRLGTAILVFVVAITNAGTVRGTEPWHQLFRGRATPVNHVQWMEDLPPSATSTAVNDSSSDDEADQNGGNRQQSGSNSTNDGGSARSAFPPELVQQGQAAFEASCVDCHDAARALEKQKTRAGWLSTVRRMAGMDGADIDRSDFLAIATYLASRNAPAQPATSSGEDTGDADQTTDQGRATDERLLDGIDEGLGSMLSISGTVSTLWRGGNDNLENPGFFVDAWMRADWQPSGPLRARVTTCTSCHSDQTGDGGFTLELVEAMAVWDVRHNKRERLPEGRELCVELELRAGRFVVPFGAFSEMSHPGIYRTLTNPLMYNMGRQVNPSRTMPPVLPAPYADEGVDLHSTILLSNDWDATLDVYAVNGLAGSATGVQFTPSRSYADNNSEPAVGGRATVGTNRIRFGGSVMSGRMHDDMTSPLHYRFAGADVTGRFLDNLVRVYFEYAMRQNDTAFDDNQLAYGTVSEVELLLLDQPNLNFLARYDTLEHRGFYGDESIERITWGLSTSAIGGSLLLLNHEHWNFGFDEPDVDVVGFRWVATF